LALSPELNIGVFKDRGPFPLLAVDEGSVALRNFMATGESEMDKLRGGVDGVLQLSAELDAAMGHARQRAESAADASRALSRSLTLHLPSISRDCSALANTAVTLREDLIALESRLFSLLLARALTKQKAWENTERQASNDYAAGKAGLLEKARSDVDIAAQLLAFEENEASGLSASESFKSSEASAGDGGDEAETPNSDPTPAAPSSSSSSSSSSNPTTIQAMKQRWQRVLGQKGPPVNFKSLAAAGSLLPSDFNKSGVAAMAAAINANLKAALSAGVSVGGLGVNTVMGGLGSAGGALLAKYSSSSSRADTNNINGSTSYLSEGLGVSAGNNAIVEAAVPGIESSVEDRKCRETASAPATSTVGNGPQQPSSPTGLSPAAFQSTEPEKRAVDPYTPYVRVKEIVQAKTLGSTPSSPGRAQQKQKQQPAIAATGEDIATSVDTSAEKKIETAVAAPEPTTATPTPSNDVPTGVASSEGGSPPTPVVPAVPATKKPGGRVAALANKFAAEKKAREGGGSGGGGSK